MNILSEIPPSWSWATVADISKRIHYGYTAKSVAEKVGPKMLRITDIQNDAVDWGSVPFCRIDSSIKQKYLLKEGDLVFARTGATVGKSFLIKGKIPEAVFASYLIRITLSPHVRKEFIQYFFHSSMYWEQIRRGQVGTGQPNVNSRILSRIVLPLPPLAEQNRIVAKIEALFAESKTVRKALDTVPALLRRFRQSVLAKAFKGELTRRDPNDEPSQKLLEKIQQERIKSMQITRNAKKREHNHEGIQSYSDDTFLELPYGWNWASLGQICHIIKDQVQPNQKPEISYNYLSIENVESKSGKLVNFSPTLGKDIHSPKLAFTTEDVLYSKLRPYLNKVYIPEFAGVSATDLIPLRPEGGILREYIAYYLRTQKVVEYANQRVHGIQLPRLPTDELLALPIPVAPLGEQRRIVDKVKEIFLLADQIENATKTAWDRIIEIDQTILDKALRGELVPQDPDDEPASMLLKRIQADTVKTGMEAEGERPKASYQSKLQTEARQMKSLEEVLREIGPATIEQTLEASGLSMNEFWDKLKIETKAGRIEKSRKGNLIFLRVKN